MASSSLVSLACGGEAEPRAQLLIVVDTDLPLVGQALERPELSYDAAIDVLRVDVHRPDLTFVDFREHLAPDVQDWPISFGVPSDVVEGRVLLHLRAFNAELSTAGDVRGEAVLDPLPTASVDRLVELEVPTSGVVQRRLLLSGDCYARPARFAPLETCVDASRLAVAVDGGDDAIGEHTLAGTWQPALEVPCASAPPADAVCVPGGFSLLGDVELTGTGDGVAVPYDPVPLRPVRVEPFFMDLGEVSVGRFRALLAADPQAVTELPTERQPSGLEADCTWLGPSVPDNDALPLNCVTAKTAAEVCAARGGRLPTEAEWEHSARGRGRRWRYPWGNAWPECCSAVAGGALCGRSAPEPTGSTSQTNGCVSRDVSRDGVLDMGGNLAELTGDRLVSYAEGCWNEPGVLTSPSCHEPQDGPLTVRGGVYNEPATFGAAPIRRLHSETHGLRSVGFRCVYPHGAAR